MSAQLTLAGMFSDTPPQRVAMVPSAIQARRSGRQRVVSRIHLRMARYAEALRHAPATDHEAAEQLGLALSVINAIRGDWGTYAAHMKQPSLAPVPIERIRQDWGSGKATTRVRWGWR